MSRTARVAVPDVAGHGVGISEKVAGAVDSVEQENRIDIDASLAQFVRDVDDGYAASAVAREE